MTDDLLFDIGKDELLVSTYQKQGRTLDALPYTDEFEAIHAAMMGDAEAADTDGAVDHTEPRSLATRAALFHRLHNLRKAGKLPRLGRAPERPPRIADEDESKLAALVEASLGKMSLRDQLPYTQVFHDIIERFNAETDHSLSQHDAWRIIAKLAK